MTSGNREDKWVEPDWWGPLAGWVGGVLFFNLVVAQSDWGVILAEDIAVYPNGIAMQLHAFMRPPPHSALTPKQPERITDIQSETEPRFKVQFVEASEQGLNDEVPVEHIRFGAEFDDGRRASREASVGGPATFTIPSFQEGKEVAPDPDSNVVLKFIGGGSSPDSLRENYFLWPLPKGNLRLFGSWQDAAIEHQHALIEAHVLQEALGRAHQGIVVV